MVPMRLLVHLLGIHTHVFSGNMGYGKDGLRVLDGRICVLK